MLSFPTIPTATNGQTLGAEQMDAYKRGLEYLLGIAHGVQSLTPTSISRRTSSTGWTEMWTGYIFHRTGASLAVDIKFWSDSAGQSVSMRICYWDDAGVMQVLTPPGEQSTGYTVVEDSVHGLPTLTDGRIYRWEVQCKSTASDHNVYCQVREFAEQLSTTWPTPPVFAAGVSDAAELNALRANLQALNALVPQLDALTGSDLLGEIKSGDAQTQGRASFIYHQWHYLHLGLQYTINTGWPGRSMKWWATLADNAGHEATIVPQRVCSGDSDYRIDMVESLDLSTIPAIPAAGITLADNQPYTVRIVTDLGSGTLAYAVHALFFAYLSDGEPAPGWTAVPDFAHGYNHLAPATMNAMADNLTDLRYGANRLRGRHRATWWYFDDDADGSKAYTGWHRKRYLAYRPYGSPRIRYGPDCRSEYSLPMQDGDSLSWRSCDLTGVGIPWGSAYVVRGCKGAFESDIWMEQDA